MINPFSEPDFQAHDYAIGGKLVVGKATMDPAYAHLVMSDDAARDQLKEKLIHDMASYMLENKLVEFTQMDDPMTGVKTVIVRAYLAPDAQVRVLRLANKIARSNSLCDND